MSAASVAPGANRTDAVALGSSVPGRLVSVTTLVPLRRAALRTRRSRMGASSTSSVSTTSTTSAWSMSLTRADRSGRASTRACSGSTEPAVRESMCGEPTPARIRCWSSRASSLVVAPPASAADLAPAFFS